MSYVVKSVKSFADGAGFEAVLHRDGKRVATVLNDGRGGNHRWSWEDGPERTTEGVTQYGKTIKMTAEQAAFSAYVATVTGLTSGEKHDELANQMIDAAENEKWLRRKCRRQILGATADTVTTGRYATFDLKGDRQYTPSIGAKIMKNNPDIIEIMNDRFVAGGVSKVAATRKPAKATGKATGGVVDMAKALIREAGGRLRVEDIVSRGIKAGTYVTTASNPNRSVHDRLMKAVKAGDTELVKEGFVWAIK